MAVGVERHPDRGVPHHLPLAGRGYDKRRVSLFGAPWDQLALENVERFLADADAEPLLWEAKGRDPRDARKELDRHDLRKEICAFANGHEAGYLILGARQVAGRCKLDGVAVPGNDPPTWLHDVASGGLRPVPAIDPKSWRLHDGTRVVVARVPPLPTRPCNSRGTVYERVAGKSIPVKEPERLAELYQRGREGHRRAQTAAHRAAELAFHEGLKLPFREMEFVQVAVAVAMTGTADDISARLFTESSEDALRLAVAEELPAPGAARLPAQIAWQQDRLIASTVSSEGVQPDYAAAAVAVWTGAVGIFFVVRLTSVDVAGFTGKWIDPIWMAAHGLVQRLGGHGDCYLSVLASGGQRIWPRHPPTMRPWPTLDPPVGPTAARVDFGPFSEARHAELAGRLARELRRAAGQRAPEPA